MKGITALPALKVKWAGVAPSKRQDAPVLLWLNGGPGASSLLGFYDELGPFGVNAQMQIVPRAVSWNKDAHLIAIDNPLGVGYSFTLRVGLFDPMYPCKPGADECVEATNK